MASACQELIRNVRKMSEWVDLEELDLKSWFFWEVSSRELKGGKQIEQVILRKGVAYAGWRTLPAVDGVTGTMEGGGSKSRLCRAKS
jgi:hypothetical protein